MFLRFCNDNKTCTPQPLGFGGGWLVRLLATRRRGGSSRNFAFPPRVLFVRFWQRSDRWNNLNGEMEKSSGNELWEGEVNLSYFHIFSLVLKKLHERVVHHSRNFCFFLLTAASRLIIASEWNGKTWVVSPIINSTIEKKFKIMIFFLFMSCFVVISVISSFIRKKNPKLKIKFVPATITIIRCLYKSSLLEIPKKKIKSNSTVLAGIKNPCSTRSLSCPARGISPRKPEPTPADIEVYELKN